MGVIAVLVLLSLAAPAGAQELRDPFHPLLTTDTTDTSTTTSTDSTTPFTPPDESPLVNPPPSTDDLPNTGTDPQNWLGVSYVLLAAGSALVAMGHIKEARGHRTV